jgi:zinc protease
VRCPSGLRVLVERTPGAYSAGVTAIVRSGSVQDPPGREGLAHVVEHLLFRSHAPDTAPYLARIKALGAGAYNGQTGFERTVYYAFAPRQSLRPLLETLGHALAEPLEGLDERTFAIERDVVRNELRERNETHSAGVAWAAAYEAALPAGHPYTRPIIGTHESLSTVTLDDARRYAAEHYHPESMTFVVAGDVELASAEAFVHDALPPALYGDPAHPRAPAPHAAAVTETPTPPPARGLPRARAAVTTPELWISWPLPGGYGPARFEAGLWAALSDQNFLRGRLADTDVAAVDLFTTQGQQASLFIARVRLIEGAHPDESLRQVVDALPWIGGDEFRLERRFTRLKVAALRGLAFGAESVVQRSRARADYVSDTGKAGMYGDLVAGVQAVDADHARDFATSTLSRERARAVLVEPFAADARPPTPVPAGEDLITLVNNTPVPRATLDELARVRQLDGLRSTKLDNGLELLLLRRPGAPVVSASLAFHGGQAAGRPGAASAALRTVDVRFGENLDDFGVSFQLSATRDHTVATVQAGAANLPRALDALSFATRSAAPDWPSDKFQEQTLPFLRKQDASAPARNERALMAALFHGHPFGDTPTADVLAAQTKPDLMAWLDSSFAPANAALVIVGDIDVGEAEAAARDSFGGWSAPGGPIAAPAPAVPPATRPAGPVLPAQTVIVTHHAGASQAEVEIACLLPPTDARGTATHSVAATLVEEALQESMRRKTGSTYGVHTWISTWRGGTSTLRISSAVDNGRLPDALAMLRAFWKRSISEGSSAHDVEIARESRALTLPMRLETSSDLVSDLVGRWNLGWPPASLDELPAEYARVTDRDVDAVLGVCGRNLVLSITGDEATIRAALASPAP